MNALSLAYSNAKNQHKESSWTDDPDLGGFITGVKPLSHLRRLEDYAQDLVANYGEFINNQYEINLDKLSAPYQLELVRLYIESIDREIEWACYGEDQSINSDFLCAMLAMLKNPSKETREHFAEVTTLNLLSYYKKPLQSVLDTACHDYHCNQMNNEGYHCEQDLDHGDYAWRR